MARRRDDGGAPRRRSTGASAAPRPPKVSSPATAQTPSPAIDEGRAKLRRGRAVRSGRAIGARLDRDAIEMTCGAVRGVHVAGACPRGWAMVSTWRGVHVSPGRAAATWRGPSRTRSSRRPRRARAAPPGPPSPARTLRRAEAGSETPRGHGVGGARRRSRRLQTTETMEATADLPSWKTFSATANY